jgi:hypothetical protein
MDGGTGSLSNAIAATQASFFVNNFGLLEVEEKLTKPRS